MGALGRRNAREGACLAGRPCIGPARTAGRCRLVPFCAFPIALKYHDFHGQPRWPGDCKSACPRASVGRGDPVSSVASELSSVASSPVAYQAPAPAPSAQGSTNSFEMMLDANTPPAPPPAPPPGAANPKSPQDNPSSDAAAANHVGSQSVNSNNNSNGASANQTDNSNA